MSPDLERLIRLQQLDLDAETRRRTLAELPAALQALDERITTRQQTLDAAKARLAENQSARRALDKDLAVVQGRLTKFKDQLMEVKTNKEYLAMQHEISMAQDGVRTFEDKILEVMVAADELDGEIKAAEKALAEEKTKVSEERSTRQQQATRMEAEIAELTGARAKVVVRTDARSGRAVRTRLARPQGSRDGGSTRRTLHRLSRAAAAPDLERRAPRRQARPVRKLHPHPLHGSSQTRST